MFDSVKVTSFARAYVGWDPQFLVHHFSEVTQVCLNEINCSTRKDN